MTEKMTKEEREMAARVFKRATNAVELITQIHEECDKLMYDFGWDLDTWEIAKSGMLVGKVALGIAAAFGYEDGWYKESEVTK